jgi:hypothetical protein
MHNQIHVQGSAARGWYCGLDTIVQRAAPVYCSTGKNSQPLENSERVAIDGKYVPLQAVQHYASSALPRQSWKARQRPFCFSVILMSQYF